MSQDKEEKRKAAKSVAKAFKKMEKPMSKGGSGGTFTAAATKAGYADTPAARKQFANKVLKDPDASAKLKKKANFYKNVIAK